MIPQKYKHLAAKICLISLVAGVLIESSFPSLIPDNSITLLDKILHFLTYGVIAYLGAYVL